MREPLPKAVGSGLVWLAIALAAGTVRGETPLEAWETVERVRQSGGPGRAQPLSKAAVREHPGFLPLVTQYLRIRTSQEGFTAARAARDSLRENGPLTHARVADVFLARESGAAYGMADTLDLLPRPPVRSSALAFHWFGQTEVLQQSGSDSTLAAVDSLLVLLSSHPLVASSEGLASRVLQLRVRRVAAAGEIRRGGPDAIDRINSLIKEAEDEGFSDMAMRMYHMRGQALANVGRLAEAVAPYQAALKLAYQLGDEWQWTTTSSWLAWALEQQERFSEAIVHRAGISELHRRMGDPLGVAYSLLGGGWDALKLGRITRAEELLREALTFGEEQDWAWVRSYALNNLGVLYSNTGRHADAAEVLQQALNLAQDEGQRTSVLNNIAVEHSFAGRPDRAQSIYEELLETQRRRGDLPGQVIALNNLAVANEAMGQTRQATVLYERSVALGSDHGVENLRAHSNLGFRLGVDKRYKAAEDRFRFVIDEATRLGNQMALADAHAHMGRCLSYQQRYEQSLIHLLKADSLRAASSYTRDRVPGALRTAFVQIAMQDWGSAFSTLDSAEAFARQASLAHVPMVRAIRATARGESGDRSGSLEETRHLLRELPLLRPTRTIDSYARSIAAQYSVLNLVVAAEDSDVSDKSGLVREAFDAHRSFKSRSLLDYVQAGQRLIEPDVPDSLAALELEFRFAVDSVQRSLEASTEPAVRDSLELALVESQSRHERIRSRVFQVDSRYEHVAARAVADDLAELPRVPPGTMILDYQVLLNCDEGLPCDLIMFVLTADGLEVHRRSGLLDMQRQADLVLDVLKDPFAPEETTRRLLGDLGVSLLGPVVDRLGSIENLVVVPDGWLSRVPFAALMLDHAYLVETIAVQSVPSLAVLEHLRMGSADLSEFDGPVWDMAIWPPATTIGSANRAMLAPLRHADDELRSLLARFADATVFKCDWSEAATAREQMARQLPLGRAKVLHFISHGVFDDLQPWRSGLYLDLPRAGEEPRKLEIADVYRLNFRSDLVTLSACESARAGDSATGFHGFAQALFGSGATSVLATLWAIDDASTPMFMTTFYEALSQGASKAQALRNSQLGFLRNDALKHPFYWAPYVLLGDGNGQIDLTVQAPPLYRRPSALLLLGALLMVASLAIWRR